MHLLTLAVIWIECLKRSEIARMITCGAADERDIIVTLGEVRHGPPLHCGYVVYNIKRIVGYLVALFLEAVEQSEELGDCGD